MKTTKSIITIVIYSFLFLACNNTIKEKQETKTVEIKGAVDSTVFNPAYLKEFEQEIAIKPDSFSINPNKDTLLVGKEGCAIFLEKNSFCFLDGFVPKQSVKVELKECLNLSDMIRENLSTLSNDKLLSTKGMINIIASSEGKELELKKGKKFIIHFPKKEKKEEGQYSLFYGKSDSSKNVNWNIDSSSLIQPKAYIAGYVIGDGCSGEISNSLDSELYEKKVKSYDERNGLYFKGSSEKIELYSYFAQTFNSKNIKNVQNKIGKSYSLDFIVSKEGKIKNVKIHEKNFGSNLSDPIKYLPANEPSIVDYLYKLPQFEPIRNCDNVIVDAPCNFWISIDATPSDFVKDDAYNELFLKKYSLFRKNNIKSIDEAELHYYIFSSSKLGWINCDYFWNTPKEKINYIVKDDSLYKPMIFAIFQSAKSIMRGQLNGSSYLFNNVPVEQDVKLVAIKFEKTKPLLSVTKTKTSTIPYEAFDYKEFSLTDLENELNTE